MADKDKGIVDQISDRFDSILDAGHEKTTGWIKKLMCFMAIVMAFLMVLMGFLTVLGWTVDFTGLNELVNTVWSLFGDAVEQLPVSDVPLAE